MCRVPSETPPHEPPLVHVASEKPSATSPKSTNTKYKKVSFIWAGAIVASVLIASTIIVVTLGLYVQREQNENENKTLPSPLALTFADDIAKSEVKLVARNEWKSLETNGDIPELKPQVKYVIICHTAGRFCETTKKCSAVVRWIQSDSINTKKIPDIIYNFILGGDENIYEGRGWNKQNILMDNSITIGIIGNYVYDSLTEEMIENIQFFLKDGVESGKLDRNYFLVPHNQTLNTISPGRNVFRVIKTWPHFTDDYIVN